MAPTFDNASFCELVEVYQGSFTKPHAKQVLLSLESPFMVMSSYDRTAVVVEHDGKRWRYVAHVRDTKSSDCLLYRRHDGTDVLVGDDAFGGFYDGGRYWFYSIDFTRPDDARNSCFGNVAMNAFAVPCTMFSDPTEMIGLSDPHITDIKIRSKKLADADGDGKVDFVVAVSYLAQPNTPAVHAKVRAGCKGRDILPLRAFLPPPQHYVLVFRYDGQGFKPTPKTRKLLETWQQAGPDRWASSALCRGG